MKLLVILLAIYGALNIGFHVIQGLQWLYVRVRLYQIQRRVKELEAYRDRRLAELLEKAKNETRVVYITTQGNA